MSAACAVQRACLYLSVRCRNCVTMSVLSAQLGMLLCQLICDAWHSWNDYFHSTEEGVDDPARRGRERLIRKLLTLPNKPAIIQYHYTPLVFKDLRCLGVCPAAVQALQLASDPGAAPGFL